MGHSAVSNNIDISKKLIITEFVGLLLCLILSFVFHFAYEWLDKSPIIAWLFATNESVWEHGKIIFYPFLLFSVIEYAIIKPDNKVFFTAKAIPLVFCIPIMVAFFYTYSGIIGKNYTAVDISLAIFLVIAMFAVSYKIIINGYVAKYWFIYLAVAILFVILLITFTYYPPHINLFYDQLQNRYGIK